MATRLLLLVIAGSAGTLCRYGLAGLVQSGLGSRFPWGTLAVNLTGCLVAGPALRTLRDPLGAQRRGTDDRLHRVPRGVHHVLGVHAGDVGAGARRTVALGGGQPAAAERARRRGAVRRPGGLAAGVGRGRHASARVRGVAAGLHRGRRPLPPQAAVRGDRGGGARAAPRRRHGPPRLPGVRRPQPNPFRQDPAAFGRPAGGGGDRRRAGEDRGVPAGAGRDDGRGPGHARAGQGDHLPSSRGRRRGAGNPGSSARGSERSGARRRLRAWSGAGLRRPRVTSRRTPIPGRPSARRYACGRCRGPRGCRRVVARPGTR